MTTMQTIRRGAVLGVFAAVVLAGITAQDAEAHPSHNSKITGTEVRAGRGGKPLITIRWNVPAVPDHPEPRPPAQDHYFYLGTHIQGGPSTDPWATLESQRVNIYNGLRGTTSYQAPHWYSSHVFRLSLHNYISSEHHTVTVNTGAPPSNPTTPHSHPYAATDHTHDDVPEHTHEPAEPETPSTPEPETPAQTCTYEHRLIHVPASTANAYTGRILISSKESKATVTIRAYHTDNGAPIDVLDSTGSAVGSVVSLAPAYSTKRFRLEDVTGWHSVIVSHPTARAMRRATVAMFLREPDVGVNIIPAQGIEDCAPGVTTTE